MKKFLYLIVAGFVWILTSSVPVNATLADNEAFLSAAHDGDAGKVQALLAKGTKVDLLNWDGSTALHIASQMGNEAVVKMLLAKGAKVDHQDKDGSTALHKACLSAKGEVVKIVKMLLEKGAKVDHQTIDGETAIMWASQMGNEAVVKILLAKGAKAGHQTNYGWTELMGAPLTQNEALLKAAYHGDVSKVKALLEQGGNVNHQNNKYKAALLKASEEGDLALQNKLMLSAGFNSDGSTALLWASMRGHDSVVKVLLGKGAKVDLQTKDGWTALKLAGAK
jgi:ankyrin repeat protein